MRWIKRSFALMFLLSSFVVGAQPPGSPGICSASGSTGLRTQKQTHESEKRNTLASSSEKRKVSAAKTVSASGRLTVDQVISRMHEAALKVKGIEAKYSQDVHHTDIGGDEIYQGELYFEHSKSDKLRVKEAFANGKVSNDVLVLGDQVWLYQPENHQVTQTTKSAQAAKDEEFDFITTPYESVSSLKSRYSIDYPTEEDKVAPDAKSVDGVTTIVLKLTPWKRGEVRRVILSINPNTSIPVRYEVDDDSRTISFTLTNVKLSQKLPNSDFDQKIPKGTPVVKK